MGHIAEFFGYEATDQSTAAQIAVAQRHCPFIESTCTKLLHDKSPAGVCTLHTPKAGSVICCPNRLYSDDYRILKDVSKSAFGSDIKMVKGSSANSVAKKLGTEVIGVFGHGWGGELRLPKRNGVGNYFVDWILAKVGPSGELLEFVAVEVQTIDTTGSYKESRDMLLASNPKITNSKFGFNWENVNKRIIPQLLYKGHVLQREPLCKKGLFFICPTPVYERIMERIGGETGLTEMHQQPSAITFLAYNLNTTVQSSAGVTVPLQVERERTTSVAKLQERFNTMELPDAGVYQKSIEMSFHQHKG